MSARSRPRKRRSASPCAKEYLADWRRGTLETLENVYIIGEDGKEHKLPKKKF